MLTPVLLDLLSKQVEMKPYLPYRLRIRHGKLLETSEFKGIDGVARKAKYAIVDFLVHKEPNKVVNGIEMGSTRDNIVYTNAISELGLPGEKALVGIINNHLANENYDKFNPRVDEKGNPEFDSDIKYGLMLKFTDVMTPKHYATRYVKGKGLEIMLNRDGEKIVRNSIRIMLEEGGDTLAQTYERKYAAEVAKFLVPDDSAKEDTATKIAATNIPPNTEFDKANEVF